MAARTSDHEPEAAEGLVVWKGFEHRWLRTVLGFHVPHRISGLHSFVDGEAFVPAGDGWSGRATFHVGQSPGVDGNFMRPVGLAAAVRAPGVHSIRGSVDLEWTDDADGAAAPQARSDVLRHVEIDLGRPDLGGGTCEDLSLILRGIELDTWCQDDEQPEGEPCNSDGMWQRIVGRRAFR